MAAKKNQVQCSFCGGNSAESSAVKFFQGQDRKAVICADCVDICIESLAEDELAEGSQVSTISHEHTPRSIFDHLCKHVVGQDDAKRILSVAAFSHMERKRLHENPVAGRVLPQKSNVLMVGATGSGKTLIASTLAKHLGVPFVSVDATRFTEAGYIGDDVQDVIPMLISAASMSGGNPEWGIVFFDECLPGDTEILTESGFVRFDEFRMGAYRVAQYDKGNIEFVKPERLVKRPFSGNLCRVGHRDGKWSHTSTPNHERVLINTRGEHVKIRATQKPTANWLAPLAGGYDAPEREDISDALIRFYAAFSADGGLNQRGYSYTTFSKVRKIDRFRTLLNDLSVEFTEGDVKSAPGVRFFYIKGKLEKAIPALPKGPKQFNRDFLYSLSFRQRIVFLEELALWDGHTREPVGFGFLYFTTDEHNRDVVQEIAHVTGYAATWHAKRKPGGRNNYDVSILRCPVVSQCHVEFEEVPYVGNVYCVTVPSGGIVIRQNGGIQITGNCDKIARKGESSTVSRDVSGEGVQQSLLKIIEGGPVRSTRRGGPMRPNDDFEIDTSNVLFILAGSFGGLEKIVARRCEGNAIGFGGAQKSQRVRESLKELSPKDLVTFGIIPELVGRLPVIAKLEELTEADFLRVLTEPVDSITRQYQTLFSARGVTLKFEDAGLLKVAHVAKERGVGSRGLRSILEAMLLETMFELPEIPKGTVVTLGADGVRRALPDSVAKVA